MYMLSDQIINLPIASLQTGAPIGNISGIVLSAGNLEIQAFECNVPQSGVGRPILSLRDIRQLTHDCLIIDSIDEISDASDIIRLADYLATNLKLPGLPVFTVSGKKLGKIDTYTVNTQTMMVQKLYIHPTFLTSLVSGTLTIDRAQIVDVTVTQIIVRDTGVEAGAKSIVALPKVSPTPE